jgi:basic membrane protein A
MNRSRRQTLRAIGIAGVAGVAGCLGGDGDSTDADGTPTDTASGDDDTVRAVFVYHDALRDFGWQWAHDQGRRLIEDEFDWVETEFFESVSPDGAEVQFRQYAERDYDVIFGTTFDYMDAMYEVAPEYPEVIFEHCAGFKTRENMGRYFGRMYQPRYLTGVAAGMMTEADELGYVAAFPNSEVIRGLNAFATGAASVNEDVTVRVEYTNTWDDEGVEGETAEILIDDGVDVMAQHQNTTAAAEVAAEAGLWATGYNAPMGEFVGDRYITSPIWDWGVFYREAVQEIHDGTWEATAYWKGLDAGIVDLDEFGPEVPSDVRETVETRRSEIEAGERDIWEGTQFADYDDDELFTGVESYVDAVAGAVPE